ncbi:unnamed protein product [Tilletia controversa]|uniref:Uncharacterized protein n=3 Tax=Tilletia TaxID=13289 RepID=A0A8X7MRE5_9BASI|nr:hypothetical protein CF328_g5351 [Tilletia controversa]KAE8197069.1 hypothetical protein CF336_g2328 [Tilletia laevis]KAE8263099.1 hypothetical protein A4X03_0g1926 [Tilletia caries]KAE8206692.1 hypothetical protein CF335_g1691 [Tilletia laevis]KAE8245215.1 hypothetical protein A4X06_0g5779 [Tilletia controversa]
MVHLRTLTTIFLSSLVAFTTADLAQRSLYINVQFVHLWNVIVQPAKYHLPSIESQAGYDAVVNTIMKISDQLHKSIGDVELVDLGPGNKQGREDILTTLQKTYEDKYGDVYKACKELQKVAPKFKTFGTGASRAKAFNSLLQNHGELLFAMNRFKDPRFPEAMHQATSTLLETYYSFIS